VRVQRVQQVQQVELEQKRLEVPVLQVV